MTAAATNRTPGVAVAGSGRAISPGVNHRNVHGGSLRCVTVDSVADGDRAGRTTSAALLQERSPRLAAWYARPLPKLAEVKVGTTYHGGQQIEPAQAALDRHAVSSGDGLCVECKVVGPCPAHEAAAKVFAMSARLPRRLPGATHPELLAAKPSGFNWLAARAG